MRSVVITMVWSVLAAGVCILVFAPWGLIHAGPWAVLGLGCLGLGVCREAFRRGRPAPVVSSAQRHRGL